MYQVKLQQFEGPLDVLLNFIEKEKLNVTEISLAKVTDQYLQYLKELPKADTALMADFLVVAAQLILIKSKSLLPQMEISPEEEVGIQELQLRLRELQILREGAVHLRKLAKARKKSYGREIYGNMTVAFYPPPDLKTNDLLKFAKELLKSAVNIKKLKEETIRVMVSFETTLAKIKDRLANVMQHTFNGLVDGAKSKMEVIVTFLVLLELVRQKSVVVKQDERFSDIHIHNTKQHG